MDWLTPERRLKVENLVVGKFYKLLPSERFPERQLMVARLHKFDLTNNILTFAYPVFAQKYPGSCEFDMLIGRHQLVSGREIDNIIPIDAPRGAPADWSPSKKYLSEIACPPAPINYNVNEPLSPENWESREAARALGVPWSKPGTTGGGSAIPVTVDGSTVPRTPVTGGGSAAATSSKKKKKTRSERRTRKTRKVSRR